VSRVPGILYPHGPLPDSCETGLVIPTFNRSDYVRACFASLRKSRFPEGTVVVVVDDDSQEQETIELARFFSLPGVPVIKIFRQQSRHFTVHESLRTGWDFLVERFNCPYLCNLDSDALVKENWLTQLRDLYRREREKRGPIIVTGFNADSHPVLGEEEGFCHKESIGGLNMFFDGDLYRTVVRPNLRFDEETQVGWDWFTVWAMQRLGHPFLCLKPSVVQHIGESGRNSGAEVGYDRAPDF
jgi:glycosyltransferase involved in cell wall biosynthesis